MSWYWYREYCKDHGITPKYGKTGLAHQAKLRRQINKAAELDEDLSQFETREEAEAHLKQKAVGMGLTTSILFSIISWLIQRLLNKWFPNDD